MEDMEDKDIKKITDKITDEVNKYLDILGKDVNSSLQRLAQQYTSIKKILDSQTEILNSYST